MKPSCRILIVIMISFAMISIAAGDNFLGINWDNVDPLCTVSCGVYNYCMIQDRKDCERPAECKCSEFAT